MEHKSPVSGQKANGQLTEVAKTFFGVASSTSNPGFQESRLWPPQESATKKPMQYSLGRKWEFHESWFTVKDHLL